MIWYNRIGIQWEKKVSGYCIAPPGTVMLNSLETRVAAFNLLLIHTWYWNWNYSPASESAYRFPDWPVHVEKLITVTMLFEIFDNLYELWPASNYQPNQNTNAHKIPSCCQRMTSSFVFYSPFRQRICDHEYLETQSQNYCATMEAHGVLLYFHMQISRVCLVSMTSLC